MSLPRLIVDGVSIENLASLDLVQTYEWMGGFSNLRMMDGSIKPRERWKKLQTRISGGGWKPPGIANLPRGALVELSCMAPLAIYGSTNAITLPTGYRTETECLPAAWGVVAGELVSTTYNIAAGVATLTAVPSATRYRLDYYPKFTGAVGSQSESADLRKANYQWDLVFDQT